MNNDKMTFSVQTMNTTIEGGFNSVKPDKDGVFRGVPLAVIGKPSRNGVLYEQNSFVDAITNPNTRFYKSLIGGGLEGEWGHPILVGLQPKDAVGRIMQIDGTKVSHYFTRIYSKKTEDGKYFVIYGDTVPFGPYGKYLTEAFADKKRNTSFSLRSLTTDPVEAPGGYVKKQVLALITFDYVAVPGFEEASKSHMTINNEDLMYMMDEDQSTNVTIEDLSSAECAAAVGCESVTSQALHDMLRTNKVSITLKNEIIVGQLDDLRKSLVINGKKHSAFHKLFV